MSELRKEYYDDVTKQKQEFDKEKTNALLEVALQDAMVILSYFVFAMLLSSKFITCVFFNERFAPHVFILFFKILEKDEYIEQLESKQAQDSTLQRQMFDMEQAYKSQKNLLQAQIEELEKDLKVNIWSSYKIGDVQCCWEVFDTNVFSL